MKKLYQEHPRRYEYILTPKGQDVLPILQAFTKWGEKYIERT